MKQQSNLEKKEVTTIKFDEINSDDILELEEVVTALMGTKDCCHNS